MSNGGIYSGVSSPTLLITGATTDVSGTYYLCEVTGYSPCTSPLSSTSALLTVSDLSITNPSNYVSCSTSTSPATFNVTVGGPADSIIWEIYNGSDWIAIDDQSLTFGAVSFGGDVFSATLVVNGLTALNNTWKVRANALTGSTIVTSNEATITINSPAVVSTPSNQTNCYSGGSSTFTVTTSGGFGTQWQYSTNGTSWGSVTNETPIGATYTNATTSMLAVATTSLTPVAGTYYYRALVTSSAGCDAVPSGSAQLLINNPTVTVSGSASTYCTPGGSAVVLTATGASTYTWSPSTGLSATTGASVNATPAVTTTYTVTGNDGTGCLKAATIIVNASSAVAVSATSTPSTICTGDLVQLSSNVSINYTTDSIGTYAFANTTGAYTSIVGQSGTAAVTLSSMDDSISSAQTLPFTFNYGGNSFTTFKISSNGWMQLGATSTATTNYTPLSGTENNVIVPFSRDLNGTLTTGTTYYVQTVGSAPNRITKVQWTAVKSFSSTVNPETANFQVWLYEGSNIVELRYGSFTSASARTTSGTCQVGLRGASNVTADIRSLSNTGSWATPTVGTANTSTCALGTFATPFLPDNGRIYRFTPANIPSFTYAWTSTPSGFTSSSATVSDTPTVNTTYNVVVTSAAGCSNSASTSVTLTSGVVVTTPPVYSTVCSGTTTTFSIFATGPGLTYQWSKNGTAITGNASASTATLSLSNVLVADSGSSYTVTVTPTCGDAFTSSPVTLTVNPLPTATISGTVATCTNSSAPYITFTGGNGTAPYTFTYTLNSGANQTVVSNGSGVATVTASVATTGSFVYTLISVADSSSTTCSQLQTGTATVTVNAVPTAVTITPTGSTTICSSDTPLLLTANGGVTAPSSYCTPAFATVSASGDYLNNFSFAGIVNNNSGDTATDFTYYSALTATVAAGTAYPVTLQSGGTSSTYAQQFRIWVDMNQNGVFESTESVFNSTAATFSPSTTTGNITIPTTALNGTTRMRVMAKYSSTPLDTEACSSTGIYGEYEDYNITISGGLSTGYVWTSANGGLYTNTALTVYNGTTPRSTIYARPTASGTVTATYTNAAGCSSSASVTITVNPSPTATITGTTSVCQDTAQPTVTFTGAGGTAPYTFTYTLNGGSSQTISTTSGNSVSLSVPTGTAGVFTYALVSISGQLCSQAQSGFAVITVNATTSSSQSVTACDTIWN